MNLLSTRVLVTAALVASPALYQGFVTGTVTMDTALERYLIVVVLAWLGLSVVEAMVGPAPRPPRVDPQHATPEPVPPNRVAEGS